MYEPPADFIRNNWRSQVKKYLPYAIAFLAGVVLADKVRSIGPLSKLPSV